MSRSRDWIEEAKWDLEHARKSSTTGDFNWACFASQQASEKAVRALHLSQGAVVWGYSVLDAIEALPATAGATDELKDAARRLDRHYIAPRYPDAHPAGAPRRYFTEADARQVIADAEKVVGRCDKSLPRQP